MSIGFLLVVLTVAGLIIMFKQQGRIVRHIKMLFISALMMIIGGCFGALSWLDAETSGNSNIFHHVNPYIWTGIFVFGTGILIIALIIGIAYGDSNKDRGNTKTD